MIDGFDIRDVRRQSLVRQMSMVLQEPYLFPGLSRRTSATPAPPPAMRMWLPLPRRRAHDFILALAQATLRPRRARRKPERWPATTAQLCPPLWQSPYPHPGRGHGEYRHAQEMLIQRALQRILQGRTPL